ncbi:EF-hand domain-containing protein [Mesobacterium pallidum]|uniref:EF-hand domain-containing protein n=1 Tax=Mesobacterium pallidum TaxID=2872037 RepID=UPI001EE16B32|nr:EF-hand domain-containing protein [Mesobacterium pallidum]
MLKTPLTALATLALATPLLALEGPAAEADVNGDGLLSWEEVTAAWPEISSDMFGTLDADADGQLNEDEVTAAMEAGTIPMTSDG